MIPAEMDSLDSVEIVMALEEVFDVEIRDDEAEHCRGAFEIVDIFEQRLLDQRPNEQAATRLRKLAKKQGRSELAEGLEGTWRREQIAAIVDELLR